MSRADAAAPQGPSVLLLCSPQGVALAAWSWMAHHICVLGSGKGEEKREGMLLFKGMTQKLYISVPPTSY